MLAVGRCQRSTEMRGARRARALRAGRDASRERGPSAYRRAPARPRGRWPRASTRSARPRSHLPRRRRRRPESPADPEPSEHRRECLGTGEWAPPTPPRMARLAREILVEVDVERSFEVPLLVPRPCARAAPRVDEGEVPPRFGCEQFEGIHQGTRVRVQVHAAIIPRPGQRPGPETAKTGRRIHDRKAAR